MSVAAGGESFRTVGELVTGNYFGVLGVEPAAGRLLDAGGQPLSAVISHGLWVRRFGAAPDVVGRPLRVSGRTFTVVGVAPRGLTGTTRGIGVELWAPLEAGRLLEPGRDRLINRG